MLAVTSDPADARRRDKRSHGKLTSISSKYNPPYAAIVVDANNGAVLHAAAADAPRHPASLTKIMTLYLLFERLESGKIKLDTPMEVSQRRLDPGADQAWSPAGRHASRSRTRSRALSPSRPTTPQW